MQKLVLVAQIGKFGKNSILNHGQAMPFEDFQCGGFDLEL